MEWYISRKITALINDLKSTGGDELKGKLKELKLGKSSINLKEDAENIFNSLVPWDNRIKRVESYFGSSVSSFFTLLRWLCYLNICISLLIVAFVTVPGFGQYLV